MRDKEKTYTEAIALIFPSIFDSMVGMNVRNNTEKRTEIQIPKLK